MLLWLTNIGFAGTGAVISGLPDNGKYRKLKVFVVASAGRVRWVSYIPIKQFPSTTSIKADRFDDDGALSVQILSSNSGLVEWVDYYPVVEVADSNAGKWRVDPLGFIPVVAIV